MCCSRRRPDVCSIALQWRLLLLLRSIIMMVLVLVLVLVHCMMVLVHRIELSSVWCRSCTALRR